MKTNKQYQEPTLEKVEWQEQDVVRTSNFVDDTKWTDPPFINGTQSQGGDFQ